MVLSPDRRARERAGRQPGADHGPGHPRWFRSRGGMGPTRLPTRQVRLHCHAGRAL